MKPPSKWEELRGWLHAKRSIAEKCEDDRDVVRAVAFSEVIGQMLTLDAEALVFPIEDNVPCATRGDGGEE